MMKIDERQDTRARDVFERAVANLVTDLHVNSNQAASLLVQQAARTLTPAGVYRALVQTQATTHGRPRIA